MTWLRVYRHCEDCKRHCSAWYLEATWMRSLAMSLMNEQGRSSLSSAEETSRMFMNQHDRRGSSLREAETACSASSDVALQAVKIYHRGISHTRPSISRQSSILIYSAIKFSNTLLCCSPYASGNSQRYARSATARSIEYKFRRPRFRRVTSCATHLIKIKLLNLIKTEPRPRTPHSPAAIVSRTGERCRFASTESPASSAFCRSLFFRCPRNDGRARLRARIDREYISDSILPIAEPRSRTASRPTVPPLGNSTSPMD